MSANPLDPGKQSADIGFISTRGGLAVLGAPFVVPGSSVGEYSSYIVVGVGGDLFLEMEDGTVNPYFGVGSGRFIPVKAKRVLTSATINSIVYPTTATAITWHGGQ